MEDYNNSTFAVFSSDINIDCQHTLCKALSILLKEDVLIGTPAQTTGFGCWKFWLEAIDVVIFFDLEVNRWLGRLSRWFLWTGFHSLQSFVDRRWTRTFSVRCLQRNIVLILRRPMRGCWSDNTAIRLWFKLSAFQGTFILVYCCFTVSIQGIRIFDGIHIRFFHCRSSLVFDRWCSIVQCSCVPFYGVHCNLRLMDFNSHLILVYIAIFSSW